VPDADPLNNLTRKSVPLPSSARAHPCNQVCYPLVQSKDTASYNGAVDLDVPAIRADSEYARAQIVNVLTAINSEV
jgi:hypothetical protein